MKNEHLVLLTNGYPYGNGESFIEEEIEFLSKTFQKITIVSVTNDVALKRSVPKNCEVLHYKSKLSFIKIIKLILFLSLKLKWLKRLLWEEKAIVTNRYHRKMNLRIIIRMVSDSIKGFALYQFLDSNLSANVLYSYWLDQKSIGLALHKILNKNSICISRAHGGDLYFERNKDNYIPFQYYKIQQLDKIFFVSETGKEYFRKITNCSELKTTCSRLGIKIPDNIPNYIYKTEKVIVSCSFILSVKRIELIIESLAKVKLGAIKWIHIGDGPLKDEMEILAAKELKGSSVEFLFTGNLTHKDVLNFYAQNQVDLFLNVSASEGIPVSIMEAMSYGIPTIATDVGGTSELVNTTNGFLLGVNEVEEKLAKTIESFLTLDEAKMLWLRNNARQTITDNFNAQNNYPNFIKQLLYLQQ